MNRIISAVLIWLSMAVGALAQFPQVMPPNTVYGRSGIGTGPGQAIPFSALSALFGSCSVTVPLAPCLNTTQNSAGGSALSTVSLNTISITESISAPSNIVQGLFLDYTYGGANVQGARQGAQITLVQAEPTSPSNNAQFRASTALNVDCQSSNGDGGTMGNNLGSCFGMGVGVILLPGATFYQEASGVEYNTELFAGSSVSRKYGVKIVQFFNDAVQGTDFDAAFFLGNQPGAVGWKNLIQIGDGLNAPPLATTGAIMKAIGSQTIDTGIDISAATISSYAFRSPGFNVDGSGRVGIGAPSVSTTGLTVQGPGTTSGSFALVVNNSTPTALFSVRDDGLASFLSTVAAGAGNFSGAVFAGGLVSDADPGGTASTNTLSSVNSSTISSGTGTVKMSSANSANNSGWLKFYCGTAVCWVPAWVTNSP